MNCERRTSNYRWLKLLFNAMTTSMHIQSLTLRSRNLEEQRTLWVDELGFAPLESNAQRLCLRIGDATLNFERDSEFLGTYRGASLNNLVTT
jgi:catechol-2,3-dioxygenase